MRPSYVSALTDPIVAHDAVAHLGGQVQAAAAVLDDLDHAQRLLVMAIERKRLARLGVDAPQTGQARSDGVLAGMAERVCPRS